MPPSGILIALQNDGLTLNATNLWTQVNGKNLSGHRIKLIRLLIRIQMKQTRGEFMKKQFAGLFLIGVLILIPLSGASYAVKNPMREAGFISPKEKIMAPVFWLNNAAGIRVNLEDYRDQVVLLFFWATW